jgi:putative tryptophan/tyrosine transport system substrate-binding protein
MTTRRQFLVAGALGSLNLRCAAAQARPARVGILSGLPRDKSIVTPLLLKGLADLGYREGAGIVVEFRHADKSSQYRELAQDLISRKCDIIFALVSEPIARALRDAGTQVPVVFFALDYDPVEKGIVSSLRRPGGHMTGVYSPIDALTAKRLEVAQEVLPGAKRFLVLTDVESRDQLAALREAAAARGVELTVVEYERSPYDLHGGFESGRQAGVAGLIVLTSLEFAARRGELSALAISYRQPLIAPTFMAMEPGVLVSYSQDFAKLFRRGAELGVRILKGAKPADMPVEQAGEFELVVNLKTAKTLGLKIPYSVLSRATKVIE